MSAAKATSVVLAIAAAASASYRGHKTAARKYALAPKGPDFGEVKWPQKDASLLTVWKSKEGSATHTILREIKNVILSILEDLNIDFWKIAMRKCQKFPTVRVPSMLKMAVLRL